MESKKKEQYIKQIDDKIRQLKEKMANVKGRKTEVYARIVGYYRSVNRWNKGKKDEFDQRVVFDSSKRPTEEQKRNAAARLLEAKAERQARQKKLETEGIMVCRLPKK